MASVYLTRFDNTPEIQIGVLLVSGLGLLIRKVLDAVCKQVMLFKIILTAFIAKTTNPDSSDQLCRSHKVRATFPSTCRPLVPKGLQSRRGQLVHKFLESHMIEPLSNSAGCRGAVVTNHMAVH